MEFSKGSESALALTITPANANVFAKEMRTVKAALLDWKAKYSDRCGRVMFTVVCEAEHHAAIEEIISQVYQNEAQLALLLQSVDVDVALLKPCGKQAKEYTLGRTRQSKHKSWWRFW